MSASEFRVEADSLGEVNIPKQALWGAQTQRAVDNFPQFAPLPFLFIQAVAHIKPAAAKANLVTGAIDSERAQAIVNAADTIIAGERQTAFPVDVYETGAGTSTTMMMNEVIAHLCAQAGVQVLPHQPVPASQSTH